MFHSDIVYCLFRFCLKIPQIGGRTECAQAVIKKIYMLNLSPYIKTKLFILDIMIGKYETCEKCSCFYVIQILQVSTCLE